VGQLYLYVGYPIVIYKLQWRNKSKQQQICLYRFTLCCFAPCLGYFDKLSSDSVKYVKKHCQIYQNKIFSYSWCNTLRLPSFRPTDGCTSRMPFCGWWQSETQHVWRGPTPQQRFSCDRHTASHTEVERALIVKETMWKNNLSSDSNNSDKLTNQMQQFYKFITWCFQSLNMFRASPRPSSGAYNCFNSLWFYFGAWW